MRTIFNAVVFFANALLTIWAMVFGWGLTARSWPVIVCAVAIQFVLACVHANFNGKARSTVVPSSATP